MRNEHVVEGVITTCAAYVVNDYSVQRLFGVIVKIIPFKSLEADVLGAYLYRLKLADPGKSSRLALVSVIMHHKSVSLVGKNESVLKHLAVTNDASV